jgi:hypothetical protein
VTIEITDKHFSAFLVGRDLDIASATLLVRAVHADPAGTLKVKLNGTSVTGFASDVSFGGLPAKSVSVAFPAGILGEHTIEIEIEDGGASISIQPNPGMTPRSTTTRLQTSCSTWRCGWVEARFSADWVRDHWHQQRRPHQAVAGWPTRG